MTNLLSRVPRRAQPWVATMVRTIYQQPSPEEVHAQHARMVGMLDERFPQAAELLADVGPDILAFTAFPWPIGGSVAYVLDEYNVFDTRPCLCRLALGASERVSPDD